MTGSSVPGALVLVFFSSCIFSTRTPDNPVLPSANYKPPTVPPDVFTNMANAFSDKNMVNYVKSFSDTSGTGRLFVFEPTAQAVSQYGVFVDWNKQSEGQYFNTIVAQVPATAAPSLSVSFTTQSVSSDSAFFEGTYVLTVPHAKPTVPQTAQGRAQFYLVKDKIQNWVIWRWVDLLNQQGDFTWSDMKGEFGQ